MHGLHLWKQIQCLFQCFFENSKTINNNLANNKIPGDDNNKTPYCCYYKLLCSLMIKINYIQDWNLIISVDAELFCFFFNSRIFLNIKKLFRINSPVNYVNFCISSPYFKSALKLDCNIRIKLCY